MSENSIICRTYTTARRHPKVVGVISGWRMPFPSTNAQLGVFLGTAILLVKTRPLWGLVVPGFLQVLFMVGVPVAGWWAVRYWRPDGRDPLKASLGILTYLSRPRHGRHNGRATRAPRPILMRGGQVFVRER